MWSFSVMKSRGLSGLVESFLLGTVREAAWFIFVSFYYNLYDSFIFIRVFSFPPISRLTSCSSRIWSFVVCTSPSVKKNQTIKRHLTSTFHTFTRCQFCLFSWLVFYRRLIWVNTIKTLTCLCLRMLMMMTTRSKMKTTHPLLMATKTQMFTGTFSVKQ